MSIDQLERPAVQEKTKYQRRPWMVAAAAFAAVLVVGIAWGLLANLGGSPDDVVDTPPPTTVAPELSGPDSRPPTEVTAVLGSDPATETYFARSSDDYDAAVMGIEPGTVTAEWFRAEGFFVVFFDGIDKEATGGLCPSAFIEGAADGDFMANAPAAGADCSAIVINELPNQAVRTLECGGSLAYRTAIPDDQVGTLFASLEKPVPTSSGGSGIMGIMSSAETSAGNISEVDISIFDC